MVGKIIPTSVTTPIRVPTNPPRTYNVRPRHSFNQSHLDDCFPGGFAITCSPKDIGYFIYIKVCEYVDDYLTKELLSESFVEDFWRFDIDGWRLVITEARMTIRNLLLHPGVYVKNGRGILIADFLHEFANIGFYKWPPDVERPRHNTKFCPHGRLYFNRQTNLETKPLVEANMREATKAPQLALSEQ